MEIFCLVFLNIFSSCFLELSALDASRFEKMSGYRRGKNAHADGHFTINIELFAALKELFVAKTHVKQTFCFGGDCKMQLECVRSSWHELSRVFYHTVECLCDPGSTVCQRHLSVTSELVR